MIDVIRELAGSVRDLRVVRCGLVHALEPACIEGESVACWDLGWGVLRVGRHAKLEDVLVVTIPPGKPPVEWYVDLPGRMAQAGLRRIELLAPAWWIGEEAAPSTAWVVDHIACHLPSPLTGSEAARHGKAFLSMRRAYDVSHVAASLCLDDAELREMPVAVVWHTGGGGEPGQEEVRRARSAGCAVVSANVAPWAVGARAAGCEFAACVRISELQ